MSQSERKSIWFWIGCIAVLSIPLVFLVDRLAKKEPKIVLWSDLQYGELKNPGRIRITEDALKDTIIPEIDFEDEPFLDCVDALQKAINENLKESVSLQIKLEDSVRGMNKPIRLRLIDVPAAEGLRYLTALAELKYRVTNEGEVEIVPLNVPDELEEGWFKLSPSFFSDVDSFSEKVDARETLKNAGIGFTEGTIAEYYPKRGLMWVRNTRDQLEIIDAYINSVFYCHPEPTWRDYAYHYWMVLTEGYSPVSTPPAISVTPVPDPFGGGASGSSEPDPFGSAPSSSDISDPSGGKPASSRKPDPFK